MNKGCDMILVPQLSLIGDPVELAAAWPYSEKGSGQPRGSLSDEARLCAQKASWSPIKNVCFVMPGSISHLRGQIQEKAYTVVSCPRLPGSARCTSCITAWASLPQNRAKHRSWAIRRMDSWICMGGQCGFSARGYGHPSWILQRRPLPTMMQAHERFEGGRLHWARA